MTTTTCVAAVLLAILTVPLLLLWRATETRQQAARRMRGYGLSYARIGARLGCSATTAKRWATASR